MTTKKTGKGSGAGRSKKTPGAAKPTKAKPPARGTVRTKAASPAARARKADAGEAAEKPKRARKPKAPPVEVVEVAAAEPPPAPAAPRRVRKGEESYSDRLRDLVDIGRQRMGIKTLRPGQPEALEHILAGRDVLAVMPTGSGKSLLYQLPSLILPGLTVVVSPLIALIKDQIDKMKALGVAVCRVDSTLTIKQKREMETLVRAPGGKLLLTTPERMADPDFRTFLKEGASQVGVSLFVVDEAHCVSQWGHDFRPSYLVIRKALEDLGRPPVLATTATAPPHVREDILHQLGMPRPGGEVEIVTTTFDRPNLHYEVIASPGDDDKNRTLVTLLKKLPRPGIVYCATVKKVEELTESLARHGIPVARYHGRLAKNERDEEQARFMAPKSELVMIATNAFGLGVDKRDIRYVMHYHVPGSLEQYAQEAGRGGRDDKPARCVLLFSPDDVAIQEFFLKGTYPTRRQVRAVYKALEAWGEHADGEPPTLANLALGARVGVPRTRTVLSLLKDEGFVVENEGGIFALTEPPPDERELNEKAKQYEARRIADRQRLDALLDYVRTPGCRSQVILRYLGEVDPPVCGRCDNDLRSKEAALAAAREASMLEDGVIQRLREEDQEDEDQASRQRRQVRARLIRIDGSLPATAAPAVAEPAPEPEPEPEAAGELARLVAEQEADERGAAPVVVPAPGPARYEDEEAEEDDELEAGEEEEDELEDEDDDEYEDDDDEYEDDDEEDDEDEDDEDLAIDKTAAALAEEGVDPEDSEITVLARKRVPKPPRKKKQELEAVDAGAGKRKRRRRRRKRRAALPPKSAFTTPVLVRPAGAPPPTASGNSAPPPPPSGRGGSSGPLVEYVRGPMRINMTPVASATPNDVAPGARGKNRRRGRPGGRPGGPVRSIVATGGQPVGAGGGFARGPRPGG
ncbi:MAG TPA: ATP-dependent DNA helicase RecQ, partial [Kofleriaceae bacterium]|nr:ATP-dependent DNA helicase RecQ [Kofleriaceae bacterium]